MLRSTVLLSVVIATTGCATATHPSGPSKQTWVARADSTLESDPGRALANYLRAGDAAGEAKVRDARIRWIRHELADRRAKPAAGNPATDLAFAAAARSEAESHQVAAELASDIDATEAAFAAAWWTHEVQTLPTRAATPFDQWVYLEALRKLVPASAPEVRRRADDEVKERVVKLFAGYEELRAKAFAHRPVQVAYETLITLLQKGRLEPGAREAIARTARASVVGVTADVCEEVKGVTGAVIRGDGAHRVTIHVQATCTSDESKRSHTETETWTTTKTEEYWDTKIEKECKTTSSYEAPTCTQRRYDGAYNGECVAYRDNSKSSETCSDVPKQVRKTREVSQQHSGTYDVDERTLTALVEGTYVVSVDGVEQRIPFRFPQTEVERQYRARKGSSSFTSRTPRSVLRAIADQMAADLNVRVQGIEAELVAAHVATARAKLTAGDVMGAESEIATALFAGASASVLDSAFEPLAVRAGMSLRTYADALRSGTLSLERSLSIPTTTLALPRADQDLIAQEESAGRVRATMERERNTREGAARELDQPLGAIAIGLDQWSGLDNTSHGLTVMWGRQRGGGLLGGFWFREHAVSLDLNMGRLALELEVPVRLGAGLRHPQISIAGYAVGGISRRGADDAMDPGVPLSLDAGYGVQLVLGATRDRRLELMAERLVRPLVEVPEMGMGLAIQQRLRYELRYVRRDFIGDSWGGGRLWCTFEQVTADDVLFVSAPTHMRTCSAVIHVMYD